MPPPYPGSRDRSTEVKTLLLPFIASNEQRFYLLLIPRVSLLTPINDTIVPCYPPLINQNIENSAVEAVLIALRTDSKNRVSNYDLDSGKH